MRNDMTAVDRRTDIRTLVIGCTPLARKVTDLLESISILTGVVNLHPDLGVSKSNYEPMPLFTRRRPNDIFWTKDINDADTARWIADRNPEVVIQCGWSQIFSPEVLSIARQFCLGIHPSPLPIGRGAAVVNWKMIEGGGPWGNSLFVMEPKTDTGDILDFEPFELEARDDIRTAYFKVDRTALKMIRRTIPRIADGTVTRSVQDRSRATRYYKRNPEDGRLEIEWDASRIVRYVRALTAPFPGAFFQTNEGDLFVWQAHEGSSATGIPGRILDIVRGQGVRIAVGDGHSLWMTLVTPPADSECWCDEWVIERGWNVGDSIIG